MAHPRRTVSRRSVVLNPRRRAGVGASPTRCRLTRRTMSCALQPEMPLLPHSYDGLARDVGNADPPRELPALVPPPGGTIHDVSAGAETDQILPTSIAPAPPERGPQRSGRIAGGARLDLRSGCDAPEAGIRLDVRPRRESEQWERGLAVARLRSAHGWGSPSHVTPSPSRSPWRSLRRALRRRRASASGRP
jgi:hypothetical protein